jgi:pilus assembly protein FimV
LLADSTLGDAPTTTTDADQSGAPARSANPTAPKPVKSAPAEKETPARAPTVAASSATAPTPAATRPVDLDLDLDLDLQFAPPADSVPAAPETASNRNSGMIEFDMDALSINPDSRSSGELQTQQPPDDDPLGTKLALAQEFHAIGDNEGARSLVKEVIAEATGSLKMRAERFLAELG